MLQFSHRGYCCPENTAVGHLTDDYSCCVDCKGRAQTSLSLHSPLIRKSLPRSAWKFLMLVLSTWLETCGFFTPVQSFRIWIAPTKLLVSSMSVIFNRIVLLNYYVQKTLEFDHSLYLSIYIYLCHTHVFSKDSH